MVYCYRLFVRGRKERNVLFNDPLNTFYLQLYGVGHMVKDHSDRERGNPLPPHGLLFPISSKGSFICTIPETGYHMPRPLLQQSWSTGWNEKYFNGSTMKDRSDDPSHHERTLLPRSYISLPWRKRIKCSGCKHSHTVHKLTPGGIKFNSNPAVSRK